MIRTRDFEQLIGTRDDEQPTAPWRRVEHPAPVLLPADVAEPPVGLLERWRIALLIGVTLFGAFTILGLHQLIRHLGTTTGALTQAIDVVDAAAFDRNAAERIVAGSAHEMAASCGNTDTVRAQLTMTFEPSGRVVAARVGGGWGSTQEGRCLERALHAVSVPAFTGSDREIEIDVTLASETGEVR